MKFIGEFYKEKVLSLPKKARTERELPVNLGRIYIEKNLFGFKLYAGKNYVECATEEEARYLKVFLDAGMLEVFVPKDLDYLRSILPELETLKAKADKLINDYLRTILSRKIKEKIKHAVWVELTEV